MNDWNFNNTLPENLLFATGEAQLYYKKPKPDEEGILRSIQGNISKPRRALA
jgi:hypothetical protein